MTYFVNPGLRRLCNTVREFKYCICTIHKLTRSRVPMGTATTTKLTPGLIVLYRLVIWQRIMRLNLCTRRYVNALTKLDLSIKYFVMVTKNLCRLLAVQFLMMLLYFFLIVDLGRQTGSGQWVRLLKSNLNCFQYKYNNVPTQVIYPHCTKFVLMHFKFPISSEMLI